MHLWLESTGEISAYELQESEVGGVQLDVFGGLLRLTPSACKDSSQVVLSPHSSCPGNQATSGSKREYGSHWPNATVEQDKGITLFWELCGKSNREAASHASDSLIPRPPLMRAPTSYSDSGNVAPTSRT